MFAGKVHVLAAGLLGGAVLLFSPASREAAPQAPANDKVRVDRYGDALPAGALVRLGTVRYRCGGFYLAFLPDNRTVVSVRESNPIAFWDARTGRLLREIDTDTFSVRNTAALSRDGKRLAVSGSILDIKSGWRTSIRVYDVAAGRVLRSFERDSRNEVRSLALSPKGDLLFSISSSGKLRIEEVATGAERRQEKFPGFFGSLALSPDGKTLAISSGPNTDKLHLWNWQAAEGPRELKAPHRDVSGLTFSSDGKLLAECTYLGPTVRLWDVAGGRLLHKLELPDHEPFWHRYAAFSPDGKVFAASGSVKDRCAVNLWDPATGKFLRRLDLGEGALAFSHDGKLLAISDAPWAPGVRVWDFAADRELSANSEAHTNSVNAVATGRNDLVATASDDRTIRIWDAATGRQRHCLTHGNWVRDIALAPDGSRLVSSSLDDTVCLWDVASGRRIYRFAGNGKVGGQRAVAFSPDGKSVLAWGEDMYLRSGDVGTGKVILERAIRPDGIRLRDDITLGLVKGRFTPDGKHLILHFGTDFYVFDTATGKQLRKIPSEERLVLELAVSPDSKLLLASALGRPVETTLANGTVVSTSAKNYPVTWWDIATGRQRGQILLPGEDGGPVAFAPDGRTFAVATSRPKACICVVELASGKERHRIAGFRGSVRSLAFLPDCRRLVSGMDDGTALVWDLTP